MSRTARLGLFILGTFAILALGIFIIGSKSYLFTSTYVLKTEFSNVAGLAQGADVLVGGVHSGTVESIELPHNASGKVTVRLEMDKDTHQIIKQDSVASIQTEGLLGNQYVAVSFGSAGKPDVKDGDTIASVPPLEMGALLDKANGLLASGQVAMGNITQITAHLDSVSEKIDKGDGTVGALINDRSLYNNIDQTSATLNQTASEAKTTVASAQKGITDFQENMEALKHNFLLRGYFKNRGYEDESELGKFAVVSLPQASPVKEFTLEAKDLFDKQDSARLKGQRRLNDAGKFLAENDFGVAVVEVSTGTSGDSGADLKLAEGRALVVHDYLAQHFGFDDTKLKTVSVGKDIAEKSKDNWGLVKILIYPAGTPLPADKSAANSTDDQPSQTAIQTTGQPIASGAGNKSNGQSDPKASPNK
jgi:phospholipid/cholesterol/gamma-HCH transport system substrate-binding protein